MKVGDIVYCKKSFENLFFANRTYKIKNISADVTIYFSLNGWTTFTLNGIESYEWGKYEDYFYTLKEVRRMKMEELNGV